MPLARLMILIELFSFTGVILGFNLLQKPPKGENRLGEFPIRPPVFVAGKLAMGVSWGFLFVQAAGVPLTPFPIPAALEYASAVLLPLGIAFVIPAFWYLRSDSRLGISNPMYLGFYLVTLASLLSVPHPVSIGCGLMGIYVHHRIVLAEERFLQKKHGASYEAYKHRVRRYI